MNHSEQDYLEIIARLAIRADRAEWRAGYYHKKLEEFEAKEKATPSAANTDGGGRPEPKYINHIVMEGEGNVNHEKYPSAAS